MKTTIHKKISREKLARVLQDVFNGQLPQSVAEPITVVIFRDNVVTGRVARKAVEKIGTDFGATLVFAARDFTREASEIAAMHGITNISSQSYGGYFWSDKALAEIRLRIATHKPLGDPPITEPDPMQQQQEQSLLKTL